MTNSTRHPDCKQLRFLLHGKKEHYDSDETLYVANDGENSVWEKVASKAIEEWRIVKSVLTSIMSSDNKTQLNVENISPQKIVGELAKLENNLITSNELKTTEEREELLKQVSQDDNLKELWKKLPLHETIDGEIVSISEKTYLENSKFSLPEQLKSIVTLIKKTNTTQQQLALQKNWISELSVEEAIAIALEQKEPDKFYSMFLDLIPEANELNNLKKVEWLPLASGGFIAPENVVILPEFLSKELEDDLKKVFQEEKSKANLSMLAIEVQKRDILEKVCFNWGNENPILYFLLAQTSKPSNYWELIIKTLKMLIDRKQTISGDNLKKLKEKPWLLDSQKRAISPENVIYLEDVTSEATAILQKVEAWEYVTPEMLLEGIDISFSFNVKELKGLFTTGDDALKIIGEKVADRRDYHLGAFSPDKFLLDDFLKVLGDCDNLRIFKLAKSSKEGFKKYILPQGLKQIDDEHLVEILNWIVENNRQPKEKAIAVYNEYLKLAASDDNLANLGKSILPKIQLLNQCNKWKKTTELCDGQFYPGIDHEYILETEQREILKPWLNSLPKKENHASSSANTSITAPDSAELLKEYFQGWDSYVKRAEIGGFLCLVAGTNKEIEKLAKSYLQPRNFEHLLEDLLTSQNLRIHDFTFSIASNSNQTVTNLLEGNFEAQLLPEDKISSLLVYLNPETLEINLIKFKPTDSLLKEQYSSILLKSAQEILDFLESTKTHKDKLKSKEHDCPRSLDEIWKDLASSRQLDVSVARDIIFDDLRSDLQKLKIEDENINNSLYEWRKAKTELTELKNRKLPPDSNTRDNIEAKLQKIKDDLQNLIKKQAAKITLAAVRKKIGQGESGYNLSSIPFELFQNADDAVAELEEMLDKVDEGRKEYVLEWDNNSLTVMHWGRPINLFTHPEAKEDSEYYRKKGFDYDLVKMLSFNISDKSGEATGKFGLGFKTVHLISRKPKVVSGDLSFVVRGGLLPFLLKDAQPLRDRLKEYSDIPDGTAIALERDPKTNATIDEVVGDFEDKVGLMLVFAKNIKTCTLVNNSSKTRHEWKPEMVPDGIEFGQLQISGKTTNLLCFRLTEGDVAIALPANLKRSEKSPLSDLSTFWVTAPTKEKLGLRFIVNAKFDVTTGRTSLDRNSQRNQQLAESIGKDLGKKLRQLFQKDWETLKGSLNINQGDEYDFWEFLWNAFAVDWLTKEPDSGDETWKIVREILGNKDRGIGHLVSNCRAVPNGLYGKYRQLVSRQDVRYIVKGVLADKKYFEKVASWEQFQKRWKPFQVIKSKAWENVEKLLNFSRSEKMQFVDALKWELGESKEINSSIASNLGKTISRQFLKDLNESQECQDIKKELEMVQFQSKDGKYVLASLLLVENSITDAEERLLAAFAPDDRLLHPSYVGDALKFFLACRGEYEKENIETIAQWANETNKREGVRNYLSSGYCRDGLARELLPKRNDSWFKDDTDIKYILEAVELRYDLDPPVQLAPSQPTSAPAAVPQLSSSPRSPQPSIDIKKIYDWWNRTNRAEDTRKYYEEKLYPTQVNKLTKNLKSTNPINRSDWLMLFFLGATHTMGRTRYEQHREFVRRCRDDNDWWKTFSDVKPRAKHQEWMEVLNECIDNPKTVDKIEYLTWMEKFPIIYQLSSYLEEYIKAFEEVEKISTDFELKSITSPRGNPLFQGGGPDAPPLNLGIGANFVLRELVRWEIIKPTNCDKVFKHCFVPKANVRRLFKYLGCNNLNDPRPEKSERIYEFLCKEFQKENISEKPTFHKYFDIPFQILSDNEQLRKEVFEVDISLEDVDEDSVY